MISMVSKLMISFRLISRVKPKWSVGKIGIRKGNLWWNNGDSKLSQNCYIAIRGWKVAGGVTVPMRVSWISEVMRAWRTRSEGL